MLCILLFITFTTTVLFMKINTVLRNQHTINKGE